MKYEAFLKMMLNCQKFQKNIHSLYKVGLDLMESKYAVSDIPYIMLEAALTSHYTNEGWGWVEWFIYENEWGRKDWSEIPTYQEIEKGRLELIQPSNHYGANDKDGYPIAYSLKSLYQLLEQDYKIK